MLESTKNLRSENDILEVAEAVLKEAKTPLNYRAMWDMAKSMGLDKKVNSEGKTPEVTMQALMYVNMKNKSNEVLDNEAIQAHKKKCGIAVE